MESQCDPAGAAVRWVEGKQYPAQESYNLCRCGHSASKPYCDGVHAKVNFDGTETADKTPYDEQALVYEGPKMDLMDYQNLCGVARFCDAGDDVWNLVEESSDPEKAKQAIYEACSCPTGRLTVVTKDGQKIEPELPQEISALQDPALDVRGPLWVKGGIEVTGADGQPYETRNRVALCRCGSSGNKPYCDASHTRNPLMKGKDA